MKLKSPDMSNLNREPHGLPSPSIVHNGKRAFDFRNVSANLTVSGTSIEIAYSPTLSPKLASPRFDNMMRYDKSKVHPHANVKIEAWIDSHYQ